MLLILGNIIFKEVEHLFDLGCLRRGLGTDIHHIGLLPTVKLLRTDPFGAEIRNGQLS
jgi:hypothetical protein